MIELHDLHFAYPDSGFALHIPALRIAPGEHVALIGASGAGKSTLLRLIAGILQPQRGALYLEGQALHRLDETARRRLRAARIGFVFQELELLDYLDVFDNIVHMHRLNRALRLDAGVRRRARHLAEALGIAHRLRQRPAELSGGERQRVAICRALLAQPALILADEATGNLDPANKRRALEVLRQTARQHRATLLAVTHDHALLPGFDRVLDCDAFQRRPAGAAIDGLAA